MSKQKQNEHTPAGVQVQNQFRMNGTDFELELKPSSSKRESKRTRESMRKQDKARQSETKQEKASESKRKQEQQKSNTRLDGAASRTLKHHVNQNLQKLALGGGDPRNTM